MERLSFDEDGSYSAVEATIHLARYAVAAPYCRGARVLDIACGEGYGARFLASAGAREVVGVEVDPGALERATERFGDARVSFVRADAVRVDEVLPVDSFDLVVSLETIEHLQAPERFLRALASVARPSASLVISCPNDHWYFPDPTDGNPHHLRKYRFDEFRRMAEAILGSHCSWLIGGPVMGFGSVAANSEVLQSTEKSQLRMLDYNPLDAAFAVPASDDCVLEPGSSSYFVGVWGQAERNPGSAVVYPLSMRAFERSFYPIDCQAVLARNAELETRVATLEVALDEALERSAGLAGSVRALLKRARARFSRSDRPST